MIPIALGLIVKAATVVRAVQAISSALRPSAKVPVSESAPPSEKVLCGRFAPTRDKYRYCGNSPINCVDPEGLAGFVGNVDLQQKTLKSPFAQMGAVVTVNYGWSSLVTALPLVGYAIPDYWANITIKVTLEGSMCDIRPEAGDWRTLHTKDYVLGERTGYGADTLTSTFGSALYYNYKYIRTRVEVFGTPAGVNTVIGWSYWSHLSSPQRVLPGGDPPIPRPEI